MKTLMRKLETVFAAAVFAEAGEAETARNIMSKRKETRKTDRPSAYKRPSQRPTLRAD